MESDIQEVVNQKATGLKGAVRLHEESAVFGPAYKFSGAKEIPVTDSIWLQRQQMEQLQVMLICMCFCECELNINR